MITKRLLLLQIVLLAGLGSVFALPKHLEQPEAGVTLQLPNYLGQWYGTDLEASQRERDVLGPETTFARKRYEDGFGTILDVSIVLSGEDMNTSIHRPERCLPAQGMTVADSRSKVVRFHDHNLTVTRLITTGDRPSPNGGKPLIDHSLHYYWFIGSTETTASHTMREFIDIRDRILKGTVQRWAYITIRASITKDVEKFGRSEAEVDKLLTDFIKRLVPKIEKPSVVNT